MTEPRVARLFEVDLVKAVGIVVVVLIHSTRSFWDPEVSRSELRIGELTRFAVPGSRPRHRATPASENGGKRTRCFASSVPTLLAPLSLKWKSS